jgi:hypothetical protein
MNLPIPLDELTRKITDAAAYGLDFLTRMDEAERVRFAVWDGQSEDGRKWAKNYNAVVFPWEGASDARVRFADGIVNERAMAKSRAFRAAKLQTAAREAFDMESSANTTILLDYVVKTLMADHVFAEVELAANWSEQNGLSYIGIEWERRIEAEPKTITLDDITRLAIESGVEQVQAEMETAAADGVPPSEEEAAAALSEVQAASIDDVQQLFLDPAREAEAVQAVQSITGLRPAAAKRVLRDLRQQGTADYHVPYMAVNRPRWTARVPFVDVFFPPHITEMQDADWVALTEWVSEAELRGRALAEGYDPEWVEEALKHKGKAVNWTTDARTTGINISRVGTQGNPIADQDLHRDEVQIVHMHYRAMMPDEQLPAIFSTTFHHAVTELTARHEMMRYRHGQIPGVLVRREYASRAAIESRGVAELAATHQGEMKVQRDSRVDRTSLATLPPLQGDSTRAGQTFAIRPGVNIPTRRGSELKFMDPPRYDLGSVEIENAIKADAYRYFGLHDQTVPPVLTVMHGQDGVDKFFSALNQALTQTLQLVQQFMDPMMAIRVTNSPVPVQIAREEIQGKFDVTAVFDVRDLDPEYMVKKVSTVATVVLPMDSAGRVDRGGLAEWAMNAIDPVLAKRVLLPVEAANAKETDEEKAALAMMAAGVEPSMPPDSGMNHPLRLQVLQAAVAANPTLQQRLQQDQMFAAMLEARVKFHQQAVMQEQNKIIGRTGSAPVTGV